MRKFGITMAVILVIGFLFLMQGCTAYQHLNKLEKGIIFKHNKAELSLSSFTNDMKSQLGVQERYSEAFSRTVDQWSKGRYGQDGVKGLLIMLQENNIPISEELFIRLSQRSTAGFNEFKVYQEDTQEDVRLLTQKIDDPFYIIPATLFGFPRIDLKKYGKLVINQQTDEAFQTGRFEGIDTSPKPEKKPEKE